MDGDNFPVLINGQFGYIRTTTHAHTNAPQPPPTPESLPPAPKDCTHELCFCGGTNKESKFYGVPIDAIPELDVGDPLMPVPAGYPENPRYQKAEPAKLIPKSRYFQDKKQQRGYQLREDDFPPLPPAHRVLSDGGLIDDDEGSVLRRVDSAAVLQPAPTKQKSRFFEDGQLIQNNKKPAQSPNRQSQEMRQNYLLPGAPLPVPPINEFFLNNSQVIRTTKASVPRGPAALDPQTKKSFEQQYRGPKDQKSRFFDNGKLIEYRPPPPGPWPYLTQLLNMQPADAQYLFVKEVKKLTETTQAPQKSRFFKDGALIPKPIVTGPSWDERNRRKRICPAGLQKHVAEHELQQAEQVLRSMK